MEEAESYRKEKMQMLKSSATEISSSGGPTFSNSLDALNFNSSASERVAYPQFPHNLSQELSRRSGIPPVHPFSSSASPYSPIPASVAVTSPSPASAAVSRPPAGRPNFSPLPSHSRSLSQPSFFSLDSLPCLTSLPIPDAADALSQPDLPASSNVTMEYSRTPLAPIQHAKTNPMRNVADEITPRKTHRRSQSDIPFTAFQSPVPMPGLPPLPQHFTGFHDQPTLVVRGSSSLGSAKLQAQFVKKETEWNKEGDSDRKSEEDTGDDLISAYMNLESVDTVNSSGTEEKRDDLDRSENEAESSIDGSVNERFERNEKNKRNKGDDFGEVNNAPHHVRSVSMDSFMGMLNFADELPKLPLSPGATHGHHLRSESMDGTTSTFSLEFGNGEFTGAELNKIMSNEKLAEIAMADPKRVKRILANRQSAARSKERKMRYISELEHRVQTLQTEATTLSAQLTLLQRDSAGLASQNNQLKFRLQAMEQQAKLRDALNEALSTELKRLKLSSGEAMSASLMFQLQQQQQCEHVSLDQLQSVEERQNADAVDDEMMQ